MSTKHNETKHIPGPLTAGVSAKTGLGYVTSYYDQIVAKDIPFGLAPLFACAPELLKALKQFYKTFALHNCPENIEATLFYATIEKAECAIAKAEGRE